MHIQHSVSTIVAALVLASASVNAQPSSFDDYDSNKDNVISRQEYQNQVRNNRSFDSVDTNRDRRIDEDEFGAAAIDDDYTNWDTDDNDYVDENEFYGGTFDLYDTDNDGYWNNDEWRDVGQIDWFEV